MVLGQALAERWLTDRCTLQSPTRAEADGWHQEATDVPCRVIDANGGQRLTSGGTLTSAGTLANVQATRVHFARAQTVGVGWQIIVTTQGNRVLVSDTRYQPLEAPTYWVTTQDNR